MFRALRQLAIVLTLIGLGWAAAKAQSAAPDFELLVDAPGGATTIACVRGCRLAWVERGVNPRSRPMPTFGYECTGERCGSGRVGGWLDR